jgi:hypothetical protein
MVLIGECALFANDAIGQSLQGEELKKGIAGCTASCNQAQTGSALNQGLGLTALQINTYCRCYCTQMATRLSEQELASIGKTRTPSDVVTAQIAIVVPICIEQVKKLDK